MATCWFLVGHVTRQADIKVPRVAWLLSEGSLCSSKQLTTQGTDPLLPPQYPIWTPPVAHFFFYSGAILGRWIPETNSRTATHLIPSPLYLREYFCVSSDLLKASFPDSQCYYGLSFLCFFGHYSRTFRERRGQFMCLAGHLQLEIFPFSSLTS